MSTILDVILDLRCHPIFYRAEFSSYSEHILTAWFLRATKLELQMVQAKLMHLAMFTSDFGENILVKGKHETGDQFFHRLEVCLFGSVGCLSSSDDPTKTESFSNIITSDYKVKDNKFVACAFESVLDRSLEKARSEGLRINTIIHKVCKKWFLLLLIILVHFWYFFYNFSANKKYLLLSIPSPD